MLKLNTYALGDVVIADDPSEWINVRGRGGAVGDGASDDTSAIQRALDLVPVSGGTVYLPPGVYGLSTNLVCQRSNVTLLGHNATLRVAAPWSVGVLGNVPSMLIFKGAPGANLADITIRDIAFQGANTSAAGTEPKAISGDYVDAVTIERCSFRDFGHEAIWPSGISSRKWRVVGNRFENIGIGSSPTAPSPISGNFSYSLVAGNTFRQCISMIGLSYDHNIVVGNIGEDIRKFGISAGEYGSAGCIIAGNYVEIVCNALYQAFGIDLTGQGDASSVSGNHVRVVSAPGVLDAYGIRLNAGRGHVVSGNSVVLDGGGAGGGPLCGVLVQTSAVDALLSGNSVQLINPNLAGTPGVFQYGYQVYAHAGKTVSAHLSACHAIGFGVVPDIVNQYGFYLHQASGGTLAYSLAGCWSDAQKNKFHPTAYTAGEWRNKPIYSSIGTLAP